jgi:dCMP deaminase
MKNKFVQAHMKVAKIYADLSYANRKKVGAVIVKDDRILSIGYNGMPSGWTNECETEVIKIFSTPSADPNDQVRHLVTKPEVLHAETNAIAKLASSTESGKGASLFIYPYSPCMECAKLIYQSGISEIYFIEKYQNEDGLKFLKKAGVQSYQVYGLDDYQKLEYEVNE